MKKIKIYLQNLKKESLDLKSYRYSNTPSLNKFERVSSFIICLIWVIYFIIGCFSFSSSAAEPVTYLGGGEYKLLKQTIPSGYGYFDSDQGSDYPFVRIIVCNSSSCDFYETSSLSIGYRTISGAQSAYANFITFYDTLSSSYVNINCNASNFSYLTLEFLEWNDGDSDSYAELCLFDSNLINFVSTYCTELVSPNFGVLMPSGTYYFTRIRNNGLKAFVIRNLIDNDPSYTIFDLEFSYPIIDNSRNQTIYTLYDDYSVLYARRSLEGYWESDPYGSTVFDPLIIDRPFAIYDPDTLSSFNSLFQTSISSDSYEDGFIDGIEQGFMSNFLNGIFDALDVFPITDNFSLLNLIQSLLGFFILIWILKLIAGG